MAKSLISILCPEKFSPERIYCIEILLKYYLGVVCEIKISSTKDYSLTLNNKTLHIQDHFFGLFNEKDGYLNTTNIPANIQYFSNDKFKADKLPVLYGFPEIEKTGDGIICHIDIFSSCFFMLTRWEEYVIKARDDHGRFPVKHALAYKAGFLDRPVVNEYVEIMRLMLLSLDSSLQFKKWEFQCIPTHDIDHLKKWGSLTNIRKKLAHDFITQKRPMTGLKNIFDLLITKMGLKKDPYDSFAYIVALSKHYNLTSRFYFLSGGTSQQDNNYKIEDAKPIIKFLQEEGQAIGFHPSYSSHKNVEQWQAEKEALEAITSEPVVEGRQHYLRFEAPTTWQIWNDESMVMDSTAGYSEVPGFRCGTCYPFYVFDFLNRKQLDLQENPLILMETTLISYMKQSPEQAYATAKELYFTVKKYNGNFTFLWHNSALHTVEDKPYRYVYENIIKGFPEDGE